MATSSFDFFFVFLHVVVLFSSAEDNFKRESVGNVVLNEGGWPTETSKASLEGDVKLL